MQRRNLPGTDLQLSVVGLGAWAMGGLWWGDDVRDSDSQAAVLQALDLGVNWIDTAPLYGHGHADEVLVQALGARKKEVIIATKVGVRWDGEGMHARSDLTAANLRQDVDASLQRLGLDCIDLLQIHWPCELDTPLQETMATLEDLRREGKFRYLGLCNYPAARLREAAALAHLDSLQTPYSLLRREFEAELQQACAELPAGPGQAGTRSLGVLAYEPLCRGLLSGKFMATAKFADSDLRARDDRFQGTRFLRALTIVSRLQLVAKRLGEPVAALAIAWVLRQPGITAAIVGAKRPGQVQENVRAAALLDREVNWPEIDRIVASYRG